MLREIKGILFDVDGTLYHQEPLRLFMLLQLAAAHLDRPVALLSIVRIIHAYRKAQEEARRSPTAKSDCGASQLERAVALCGESPDRVRSGVEEWFETRPLSFLPYCRRRGLRQALSSLKAKGYRLGVYSDYPAERKVQVLGIRKYFQTVVSSQDPEVFGFKPRTNGFTVAASRMGLAPASVLYVGDRDDVDGAGAIAAGMTAAILGRRGWSWDQGKGLFRIASFRELVKVLEDEAYLALIHETGEVSSPGGAKVNR